MMNESIPSLLRESNKQIRLLVAEAFRAKGLDEIRPQEGILLWRIYSNPDCTSADLQASGGIAKSSVSESLSLLTEKGYIEYSINPENRREKIIRVTEKGADHQRRVDALFEELGQRLLKGIPAQDQEVAKRVIQTIIENAEGGQDEYR